MENETILVVDDEQHIVELVRLYLEKEGFSVDSAFDGAVALEKIKQSPPILVILDLMLPKVDGWDVCRQVRAYSNLPLIMLTARDDDIDKIVGLELGADDYLTKPFNPRELVARVKAVLRRGGRPPALTDSTDQTLEIGNVSLRIDNREVYIAGNPIELRTKEFDLLQILCQHQGKALSREQLLNLAWGFDFYGETRTVDVHVAHLRKKLEPGTLNIETVWGIGYKLSARKQ